MPHEVLGIDIGNVLVSNRAYILGGSRYLEAEPMPGAFPAIARLAQKRFDPTRIHVVSRVYDAIGEARNRHWLNHHRFFAMMGIPESNVHFCLKREEKAPICKELGVTHFIDDRLEVLSHMVGIVPNLYLLGPSEGDLRKFRQYLPKVTVVQSWDQIQEMLL